MSLRFNRNELIKKTLERRNDLLGMALDEIQTCILTNVQLGRFYAEISISNRYNNVLTDIIKEFSINNISIERRPMPPGMVFNCSDINLFISWGIEDIEKMGGIE